MAQWMTAHGTDYAADIVTYQHVYGAGQYDPDDKGQGTNSTYENAGFEDGDYIPGESLTGHACANDAAVYKAATAWQEIVEAGYQAYAYAEQDYAETYPWGSDWVENLEDLGGTSGAVPENVTGMFDAVESSILYAIQSGTINDVIGDDFDLTDKGAITADTFTLTIGGVAPSADTVKDGSYTLARPFNIVTNGEPTDELAVDFINYCMSAEGQALATEEGYIGTDGAAAFEGTLPAGSITVGGSSSVSPLMEKLIEGYQALNPDATIELMTTDSTTGVTGALDGSYTIGMASREVKEEETSQGAVGTVLAMDGIAVVVNPANTAVDDLSIDQVRSIYVGETTSWDAL